MVIELVGLVGGVSVATLGGLRRARRRRDGTSVKPVEMPRANPAWHLLGSDEELRDAIDRAISCEQASMAVLEQRAKHFTAMRRCSAPTHPASQVPASDPTPRAGPRALPRAS